MTKALTLHQPYATLVALGVKSIETRSWRPPAVLIGQRLLIHAAARKVEPYQVVGGWDTGDGTYLAEHLPRTCVRTATLPLGAIVASCVVSGAVPMMEAEDPRWRSVEDGTGPPRVIAPGLDELLRLWDRSPEGSVSNYVAEGTIEDQRPYGDFAPGRWAWILDDVKPTTERCPACWGTGMAEGYAATCPCCGDRVTATGDLVERRRGAGMCGPIPAKGKQGLWNWEPAA